MLELHIHLISYHLHTAILPNSLFTHLETYIKMYEFHPTITQQIMNRNFFSVCVINPQKLFLTDGTSTESKSLFGNFLPVLLDSPEVFIPYGYGWLPETETHKFFVASYTIHYCYFMLMLIFIQGLKMEVSITSDEPLSSTTVDRVLIELTAYFKQNPVGCTNEMQGTEWHFS